MDNGLRIVQGNTFAIAIEIHAVNATGQPIVDWSLQDSTDIRVWYVFAGREQDITTWQIDDGKLVILWLANMQRVGTYDIFCAGKYNGADWRNAMQYQFSIVRFNHEANIPANVVILDGIYQLSAELQIITQFQGGGGGGTPSTTLPLMDGEAQVGAETAYARGDHRHPSDTSKQDVIADLAAIRSGAEAGATAYQKPANGIPSTDLTSGVQTSLGKADTAVQPAAIADMATETYVDGAVFDEETRAKGVENALQDAIDTKQDTISDLSTIRSGAAAGATAYQKPSTGIPKTDLASAVQTSLGKADTAMQAFIYDIDASNLDEYGEKIVESSTPYTAIHAAYQAGKTIYVRLTNNIAYPFILNMVSTSGMVEGGYEFTAMVQNGGATYTANVDISTNEYYIECHQLFFLENETDPVFTASAAHGITSSDISTWNGKADKVLVVNHGTDDTTYTLPPNQLHIWGTVASLSLTLATPADNTIVNLYMFEFTSGATATTLSLPSTITWEKGVAPTIEADTIYEITIQNNRAKFSEFPTS